MTDANERRGDGVTDMTEANEGAQAAKPDPRTQILAQLERERGMWARLVDEVGLDRMDEPGPMGEWTFKDLTAHLLGWRRRTVARLEAAAAGRAEPAPPWPAELDDDDRINDWIQEQSRGRSVDDVLDEADCSYRQLATAISSLPPALLTDSNAFPWMEGKSLAEADLLGHLHEEHLPSIRVWLAARR